MKRIAIFIMSAFLFFSCEKEALKDLQPNEKDQAVSDAQSGFHAQAILSGDNEVPSRPTKARGVATFHLNKEGDELSYRIIVSRIENPVASHIHLGAPGVSGPAVVGLFSGPAGIGIHHGVLAEGVITAADLIGPLANMTLADLLELLQSGNAYVNVHTNDGIAPVNTGPGDFPGGEIRGQVKANKQ